MIDRKIRAFLLIFFIALVVISSKAFSDDSEPQKGLKERTDIETRSLLSNAANNPFGESRIEETFLGKIKFYLTQKL